MQLEVPLPGDLDRRIKCRRKPRGWRESGRRARDWRERAIDCGSSAMICWRFDRLRGWIVEGACAAGGGRRGGGEGEDAAGGGKSEAGREKTRAGNAAKEEDRSAADEGDGRKGLRGGGAEATHARDAAD